MTILIGRNGPRNQIWLLAALELPYQQRVEAMADIADMLGTSYALVQATASQVRAAQMTAAVRAGKAQAEFYRPRKAVRA